MKTKLLWFSLGILGTLFFLWVKKELSKNDADNNTVYSSKYKEELFNEFLIGKSEKNLIKLLGEPLQRTTETYHNKILYTNNNQEVYLSRESNCIRGRVHADNDWCLFEFDNKGNFVKSHFRNLKNEYRHDSLNKADVIKIFGIPDDEIFSTDLSVVYVLSFADFKKPYGTSGKLNRRYVRKVVLNRNKIVVRVIKDVIDMDSSGF